MNKLLIISNPSSGEQTGADFGEQIQTIFKNKGYQTSIYLTKGKDNFTKIVEEGMEAGVDTVAVLGGDGTVSEFVNGVAPLKNRPKILLVPVGTTNNFARSLGSELNPTRLLEQIVNDELSVKQSDVGQVNQRYFVSSVAIGVVPSVGWKTDDELKARFGSFAYVLEALKVMSEEAQESFDVDIQIETERLEEKEVFLLVIGLSNSVFGIPTFFEGATYNDGQLHIFGLKKSSLLNEANAMLKYILTNDHQNDQENSLVFNRSFTKALVKSKTDLRYLVDGEKGKKFPLNLSVLHNHLTFLVAETVE